MKTVYRLHYSCMAGHTSYQDFSSYKKALAKWFSHFGPLNGNGWYGVGIERTQV